MVEEFLKAIYQNYEGIALVLMVNRSIQNDHGKTRPFKYPEELSKMAQFILDMDDLGVDVYAYMSLFKRLETESRWDVKAKKEYSIGCPEMWIDADACHPSYLFVPPAITLETSPGSYQAFWPMDHMLDPQEAEGIAKRLAYYHIPKGADDGGWQCNKAMRIPGTHNHKPERIMLDGSRPVVKMLKCETTPLSPSIFDNIPSLEQIKLEQGTVISSTTNADYVGSGTKYTFTEDYPDLPDLPGNANYPVDVSNLWNMRQFDDRSGWANAMVKGLYQCGLPDDLVVSSMVGHPIYINKAFDKWGGQPAAIREDVLRILERLRSNGVMPRLVLEKKQAQLSNQQERLKALHEGRAARVASNRVKIMTPQEVTKMPPLPWLIDGYIPQRAHINVFGPSGVGKSFQLLDWAFRIAEGYPWNGVSTFKGTVIYVVAEGLEMMGTRIESWCKHKGIMVPERSNLFFYSEPVQLSDDSAIHQFMIDIAPCFEPDADEPDPEKKNPPVLIIFDTLSQCLIGGDENSPEAMTKINGTLFYIRETLGCATILVHHTGYDGDHERGHSSLPASAATRIKIDERMGQLVIDCEKQRGGKEFDTVYVDRIVVDESLVLEPVLEAAKFLTTETLNGRHIKILTVLSTGALGRSEAMARTGLQERPFMRYKSELEQSGYLASDEKNKVFITDEGTKVLQELLKRKAARSLSSQPIVVEEDGQSYF